MTCKGIYCNSASDCVDTACPGHPGQHCADLRSVEKVINDELMSIAWAAITIVVLICWLLIAWAMSCN